MEKKLITILILGVAVFLAGCAKNKDSDTLDQIQKRGKIIVGVKYDAKPFGYINANHQLVGYDIDLAKAIAKYLLGNENKVEFKQVTSSSRIMALNSGVVDMVIATMSITRQRKEVVDFSIPYYISGQALLVPENSDIDSMSDLNGKKVIIVFGSTSEKNLRLIAPEAKIIGFKTYIKGYNALKHGRADAMTSDDTILLGFAIQDPSVKLLPQRYSQEPYAVALRKGETSQKLKNKINLILENMHTDGDLNKLKGKWTNY